MKPSLAIAILGRSKGPKDDPDADDQESDSEDAEVLGQDVLDAINAKDAKALCDAICAIMEVHSADYSKE